MTLKLPVVAIIVMITAPALLIGAENGKVTRKDSPKGAWEWTVEERIALRTDADLARERVRGGNITEKSNKAPANPELRPIVDAFEGKTHPELFLPYQVFDELIRLAFLGSARTGELIRRGWMPQVKRHGLPADFWARLQSLSTVYISDSWAENDMIQSLQKRSGPDRQRGKAALNLKQADLCRSRANALAAARSTFGRERFDRFLYKVVAVNMFSVADRLPDAVLLRQAEEGCR